MSHSDPESTTKGNSDNVAPPEARDEPEVWPEAGIAELAAADADLQEQIEGRDRILEVLEESRGRFELMMRATQEGLWDWNIRTGEVYFSSRWKGMLGYEDHEVEGRFEEWERRLHPDDRQRAMTTIQAYLRGDEPSYQLEHRLLHRDGTYRWILARGFALRDEGGKPYRMTGTNLDVTDRKKAEEALRKNNALVQLLRGGATASNEASTFEEAMRECLELIRTHIGWPVGHIYTVRGEMLGELLATDIWYLESPERFEAFVKATKHNRLSPGVGLSGRVLASGEPLWIADVGEDPNFPRGRKATEVGLRAGFAFPVLVGNEVAAVVELFTTEAVEPDEQLLEVLVQVGAQLGRVVERERAQQKLNQLNDELEVRNRELDHKNKEIEAFVYGVSHDLRSPLVNLEGFSQELALVTEDIREMFANSGLPPETRQRGLALIDEEMADSIHFIQVGVRRLSGIIDALLRLSRAGRVEYRWQEVNLNAILERVLDAMRDTVAERGTKVAVVGDLPPTWGDATQLEQAFANLIGNALNYLDPERSGVIEVGCQEEPEAAGEEGGSGPRYHTYYVKDNGLGISEHALPKIFQVFHRLHPEKADGEGMGLTLVQRIVERHNGIIWAESVEGEGSTFFVRLPNRKVGDLG